MSVLTQKLSDNARRIQALLAGVSLEQARWKPQPAMWSMREVIGHLADKEQYNFRVRLDYTLHRPGERWPPIDPEGWVTGRRYNEGDLTITLERFLQLVPNRSNGCVACNNLTGTQPTLHHLVSYVRAICRQLE
ncbi:DinB family protein [Chloroflexus sp.]|uniref:DinB family protein n=1 Tax=Chloroflexus sp. TaxID=1904827 RepID=UPI00404B2D45